MQSQDVMVSAERPAATPAACANRCWSHRRSRRARPRRLLALPVAPPGPIGQGSTSCCRLWFEMRRHHRLRADRDRVGGGEWEMARTIRQGPSGQVSFLAWSCCRVAGGQGALKTALAFRRFRRARGSQAVFGCIRRIPAVCRMVTGDGVATQGMVALCLHSGEGNDVPEQPREH